MDDKPVVIFGAGQFGEVASVYLTRDSPRDVVAFTVDGEYVDADTVGGLPLIAFEELLESHPPDRVDLLVALGYQGVNRARREIYERCKQLGYGFVTYVSSRAMAITDRPIGENTFIFEANVVQPFVEVADNVVLWSGNHIGHHSRIASHCFIGVNATFRDGISVGARCVVGAGAVVLADQEEGTVLGASATPAHAKKSWELRHI